MAVTAEKEQKRFLGTKAAAEYSGIPANTLRVWRSQGGGPKYYKPRGRALYDIDDLDEFIRSGFRVSSVRASKEERNVSLSAG
ncbi:MAG: helix-turn-helix domain-containing protein [Candidatus Angelobacter sp.]